MGHGQTQGRLLGAGGLRQPHGCWDKEYGALMAMDGCRGSLGGWLAPCQKSRKVVGSPQFRAVDTRASQIVVKDESGGLGC